MEAVVAGAGLVGAGVLAYGVVHPRAQVFGKTHFRFETTRSEVALTFDDGPHSTFTPRVLDALAKAEAKATFFCVGKNAEACPGLLERMVAEGHSVENHTHSHNTGAHLFRASLLTDDVKKAQELILARTGKAPVWYRPAVGLRNPVVHAAAKAVGLKVVTWTHAARDGSKPWTTASAKAMGESVVAGDILVLHDGLQHGDESIREATLEGLQALLAGLKARGLAAVSLPR